MACIIELFRVALTGSHFSKCVLYTTQQLKLVQKSVFLSYYLNMVLEDDVYFKAFNFISYLIASDIAVSGGGVFM
jgi:hypothetical protein